MAWYVESVEKYFELLEKRNNLLEKLLCHVVPIYPYFSQGCWKCGFVLYNNAVHLYSLFR